MEFKSWSCKNKKLDSEELTLFHLSIDGCFFGRNRFFEEPLIASMDVSSAGRFVAATERRMSKLRPLGESRLVVLDRTLKTSRIPVNSPYAI
jgi:hypothetical protein